MKIFDEKKPMAVRVVFKDGFETTRPIAALFKTEKGLAFFDIFWPVATLNPIHFVEGKITGQGPWKIINPLNMVFEFFVMEEDAVIFDEWENWQAYLAENPLPEGAAKKRLEEELRIL